MPWANRTENSTCKLGSLLVFWTMFCWRYGAHPPSPIVSVRRYNVDFVSERGCTCISSSTSQSRLCMENRSSWSTVWTGFCSSNRSGFEAWPSIYGFGVSRPIKFSAWTIGGFIGLTVSLRIWVSLRSWQEDSSEVLNHVGAWPRSLLRACVLGSVTFCLRTASSRIHPILEPSRLASKLTKNCGRRLANNLPGLVLQG